MSAATQLRSFIITNKHIKDKETKMAQPDPRTFLIHAAQLLTMPDRAPALRAYSPTADLAARDAELVGLIEDAGVFVKQGKIAWIGPWGERPKETRKASFPTMETGVAMPGLVECHTHSVFGGHRAGEFMSRNAGQPYIKILEAGGGILSTVEATRKSSVEELTSTLIPRALDFVRRGVTTLEIKSGYGLTTKDEMKQLEAVRRAAAEVPCELVPCFLGAHAIPKEHRDNRAKYVDLVCEEMIPRIADKKLATHIDVFCDQGAFTVAEARRVLETGKKHKLIPRIHADEIADIGATRLPELAAAGVTGVLMPAVNLFLGTTGHMADARGMLNAGMEIALSTDFNPGSAMTQDLGLMLSLACTLYKLTPGEALRAVTLGAANALGRRELGRLRVGQEANITAFDAPELAYIPYYMGASLVEGVVSRGEFVYWTDSEEMTE
jgi:imidazolonepropionase